MSARLDAVLFRVELRSYNGIPTSGFSWRKLGKLLNVLKVDAKSVDKVKRFKAKGIDDRGQDEPWS